LLEEQRGVARVQPVNVGTFHVYVRCSRAASLPERLAEGDRDREPEEKADRADEHGRKREPRLAGAHARRNERDGKRGQDQAERVPRDPHKADEDRDRGEEAGDRLRRPLLPALVEDFLFCAQRSAILPARAAATRALLAAAREGPPCGRGGRRRERRRRRSRLGGGESGTARTPAGPPPPR